MKKFILLLLVAALVGVFFAFDLHQYLTLETLQARRDEFIALKNQSPWLVTTIAFLGYVPVAALSLPGVRVLFASKLGVPVSTTHVSIGSIAGVGMRAQTLDWGALRQIMLSWLATLPLAAALAFAVGSL